MTDVEDPRVLILWSVPRSRSTAFFRMMAERGDFHVLHEPFSYLAEIGSTVVDGAVVRSEEELIDAVGHLALDRPVFIKDTTDERYPGVLADHDFLAYGARHTFLIRDPRATIPSYYEINPDVAAAQIGFAHQWELHEAVEAASNSAAVVLEGDDLVSSPHGVITEYCRRVGIPFLPQALEWSAGHRAEWQPSERWHVEVSTSTGFLPDAGPREPRGRARNMDRAAFDAMLEENEPYYLAMRKKKIEI